MSSTFEGWKIFFITAGVAEESASIYAAKFVEEEMSKNVLRALNTDTLGRLGIMKIGHQMAILKHVKDIEKTEQLTVAGPSPEKAESRGIIVTSYFLKEFEAMRQIYWT